MRRNNAAGSRRSTCVAITTRAPTANGMSSCRIDDENEIDAVSRTTSGSAIPSSRLSVWAYSTTLPWLIATPLGRPVEPEVNIT